MARRPALKAPAGRRHPDGPTGARVVLLDDGLFAIAIGNTPMRPPCVKRLLGAMCS